MTASQWPDPFATDVAADTNSTLSEPYTKEMWRAYLDYRPPTRPQPLTLAEYSGLSNIAKDRYDRARSAFHSSLEIVQTPCLDEVELRLRMLMDINQYAQPSARIGLIVSGPTRMGKSTSIKVVLSDYERFLRERHPEKFTRRGDEFIPVAFIQTPQTGVQVPGAMLRAIASYYGLPIAGRVTIPNLQEVVVAAMTRCGTQVLVIDDLHFLDLSEKSGRDANNLLKALANRVATTFVAVGVDIENTHLFTEGKGNDRATQTSGRFSLLQVKSMNPKVRTDQLSWISLIHALEGQVVLLAHPAGSLAQHWQYLYDRTQGRLGALYNLIRLAAHAAQATGVERITLEVMQGINLDYLSESNYSRLAPASE